MKKVVIVGAGFAGLAAAVQALDEGWNVEVIDAVGIGGGASGIAAGLLHPYPGKQMRRAQWADEAMAASMQLLEVAEKALGKRVYKKGLVRVVVDNEELLKARCAEYDDLEWKNGQVHITSGVTVFSKRYLEGLWRHCEMKGAKLTVRKVEQVPDGYDRVILAAGAGMRILMPELQLRATKGQVLECTCGETVSIIGDGYLAVGDGECILGSTYERNYASEECDLEEAKRLLMPRARKYLKGPIDVKGVRCGMRVNAPGHYLPLVEEVDEKTFVLTGFGSRGLLYHALAARWIK